MIPDDAGRGVLLEEAMRELEAAIHDARVAFDCVALDEFDRAYESAVTARVAIDAAVTALEAVTAPASSQPSVSGADSGTELGGG